MKKLLSIILALFATFSITLLSAQNKSINDVWEGNRSATTNTIQLNPNQEKLPMGSGAILYDNGPLVNSPGTGAGGADESVMQTSLGLNTFGYGNQIPSNYWIADDFVVPAGGWDITKFAFYAYQTLSPTTSTMTDVHFIIYDGVPGVFGTHLVWGDETTNRLTSTTWSDTYRVSETTIGDNNRPIMEVSCDVIISLPQGTYWVAWQTGGSLSSGPWAPPITINGQATTGNAMQSLVGLTSFTSAIESSSGAAQGFPFVIYGADPIPLSNWPIYLGILLIGTFIVVRYRKNLTIG